MKSTSKKNVTRISTTRAAAPEAPTLEEELDKEAALLPPGPFEASLPMAVFLHEASLAAAFLRRHWAPTEEVPEGLCMVGRRVSLRAADEIDALVSKVTASNRAAVLAEVSLEESQVARARFLLREVRLALGYFVDDGVTDVNDKKVEALARLHATDPSTIAKLGHALGDYAAVAAELAGQLEEVIGLDPRLIEECQRVAQTLRGHRARDEREVVAARTTRAKYLAMIDERVGRIRRAARYVFRAYPDLLREVSSAYTRETRRARRRGGEGGAVSPEGTPVEHLDGSAVVD